MADLLDTLSAEMHTNANLTAFTGLTRGVGLLAVESLQDYPRIVWVSTGGTISDTFHRGLRSDDRRQRRSDEMAVELHIWNATEESTRDLMHAAVLACVTLMTTHGVTFGRYRWVTNEAARSEYATRGAKIVLSAVIRIPIAEDAPTTATVANQSATVNFEAADDGATEETVTFVTTN